MSLRKILKYPDSRLRQKAQQVDTINKGIQALITDMFETMYHYNGCGLAATQINVKKRIVVIDIDGKKRDQFILLNPEIIESSGSVLSEEGCLSVPDKIVTVERKNFVKVKYMDLSGAEVTITANNDLSACLQHEIDHLDGMLIIDKESKSGFKNNSFFCKIKKFFCSPKK